MGLTKEQKIEKKKAARAQKKQAAIEAKRRRKHEELERELAAHQLWKQEVDRTCLDAALRFKLPALRTHIEALWHTLDHAYDKKDGLIAHLIRLREIADVQYHRTLGMFCITTDNIISNFLSDLEKLRKSNDAKTVELLNYNREELAHYMEAHEKAEIHLQLLLYTSHHAADELAWNTRGDGAVRRDDDAASYLLLRDALRSGLEDAYCALWEDYKATLRSYIRSTAENQKQLRMLRKKERMMADIISGQAKKLLLSERSIRHLNLDLRSYETGEKQASFRDRRSRHRDACNRLKVNMNEGLAIDAKQITMMVKASDGTIEWFEAAQKKCEKILRLAAQCRKLETQREKVMPYKTETPPEETPRFHVRMHPDDDPMVYDALSASCGLARLWRRISNAELSKRALLREKIILERENAELERQILEQGTETWAPTASKCLCAISPSKKRFVNRPTAVDGALEIRKILP